MLCSIDPSFSGFTAVLFDKTGIYDILFIHLNRINNCMDSIIVIEEYVNSFLINNLEKIELISIETPVSTVNPKVYGFQMRLYQQILYLCLVIGLNYVEVNPRTAKKIVLKGNSSKEEIVQYLKTKSVFANQIDGLHLSGKEEEGLCDALIIGMAAENKKQKYMKEG